MYDLIIIGAGPGGYDLAISASEHFKVLLIEADKVGGTCLHRGCIPTKALFHVAGQMREFAHFKNSGINATLNSFDYSQAIKRNEEITSKLHKGMMFGLKNKSIDFIIGTAKFISNTEIAVDGTKYHGKRIVIATGSKAVKLPLPGFDDERVLTSTEILKLNELPKRLAIIGAGVIGVEFAAIFNALGSEVTLIEREKNILSFFDNELSRRHRQNLSRQGIKLALNSEISAITPSEKHLTIHTTDDDFECDYCLVAVGRTANIGSLGLENTSLSYDKSGIFVDENMQTNVENIYAIGDCNGKSQLAYTASFEAKRLLNHLLKQNDSIDFSIVPQCVFSYPEVSSVGLTEEECKQQKLDYKVYKYLFRANGKAVTMNNDEGFIKVIVSDNNIYGVHIIGPLASELIHEATLLLNSKLNLSEFVDTLHIHPTLSEIYLEVFPNKL